MATVLASSSMQEQNPVGTAHFVFGLVVIIMQLINVRVAWQCMVICVASCNLLYSGKYVNVIAGEHFAKL